MANNPHFLVAQPPLSESLGDRNVSPIAVQNQHSYRKGVLIRGFSIIELMVTLAIISLLALVAAPSFVKNLQARNLVAATEDLYGYLQQARVESLSRSKPIYLNLSGLGTSEWAYGLNVESTCNPEIESNQEPSACVLMVICMVE